MRKSVETLIGAGKCDNWSLAFDRLSKPTEVDGKEKYRLLDQKSTDFTGKPNSAYVEWVAEWVGHLESMNGVRMVKATTTSPLALGLGEKNVYETGLTFSKTFGMPMIPGSSLKGAMRRAAIQLLKISGHESVKNWSPGDEISLGEAGVEVAQWCTLFGTPQESSVVQFFQACPKSDKEILMRDTVTVHHPNYYQPDVNGSKRLAAPSDWDDPNPLGFLSVKPGVEFVFALQCADRSWLDAAEKILVWTLRHQGLGAKTNAGYGRFSVAGAGAPSGSGGVTGATTSGVSGPIIEVKLTVAGPQKYKKGDDPVLCEGVDPDLEKGTKFIAGSADGKRNLKFLRLQP